MISSVTRQHVGGHVDKQSVRYFYAPAHPDGRTGYRGDGIQNSRPRGAERFRIFDSRGSDTYIDLDIKIYVRGKMVSIPKKRRGSARPNCRAQ